MNFTVEDAVDFAMTYRRNKVFRGMDEHQIARVIADAIKVNGFAWVTDPEGRITGMVVSTPEYSTKRLHVKHVLALSKDAFLRLLEVFKENYTGWTITAKRRGRFMVYRTPRLVHLLEVT